ncbi:MAG: SidA/IucD/PvdA family monooxygenase [Candidatus Halichondribacter symbioticus]
MNKFIPNNYVDSHIYDCVGIGFGPSNISLAIALEERGLLHNSLFLEAQDEVRWHPGMLIEGTDIQHNPLRDFVTPRNPCSPYGFLSYLKNQNRLFDYLNLAAPFPPRTEYAGYVSWVGKQFTNYVKFGAVVNNISIAQNKSVGQVLEIRFNDGQCYHARAVVLGNGRSINIPSEFSDLLCENVIHSDDYIWAKKRWLNNKKNPTIAVIGGSQSAVEILLDLSVSCSVVGITRSFGFKQKDLSPFTECIYYPDFVDYFHGAGVQSQNQITKELWRSNYGAADHDVINTLNFRLYEQKITKKQPITLHQNSLIKKIELSFEKSKYQISLADRHNQKLKSVFVDGIIFATGYKNFGKLENQENYHPLLEGIADNLVFRDDGGPDVSRDYQMQTKGQAPLVYLNGLCESSHGFGDAGSFSILSIRGDVISASLQENLYPQKPLKKHTTIRSTVHV